MRRLELLVPPPLVMLMTGLLMWLLSKTFPVLTLSWPGGAMTGLVLSLLGVAISLAGVAAFKRAGTTIDPKHPVEATSLVSVGIYRYSRNPMYLGVLFVLVGWAFYLSHMLSALCVLFFIAYITRYQILPEERLLQEKFGVAFLTYKGRVRRWL
ncbi:isoprenylcysteine carboxylmethyltransferase family protein [Castellaniella sp. GW247-6E4]|uniref:methyltransferase family protein n=1 Tax=Castellaniella sp. GW247-6E4 TaxID=3140380 RepID=UPI003314E2A3